MVGHFKAILDAEVLKHEEMWNKVTACHDDIDETIKQIDMIRALQDEEIFEDMRNTINKIGFKKFFLDSL